ncbi:hypothetical protein PoB_006979500 [Plakobranchus ocellatus]|uniref:Uncharacterized protein n=1 Tax=Plakobranchus ocellatus TaxID=259542 RepID=A0AAV4DGY2_9GAST|nr:hypothetical protein PoB_006979500 [Plakobranchus ocellatus]
MLPSVWATIISPTNTFFTEGVIAAQGEKSPEGFSGSQSPGSSRNRSTSQVQGRKVQKTIGPSGNLRSFCASGEDDEDTISSILGDSSTPSSPRVSASPMECPPSPSKSRPLPPAEKPQAPPPSPSPPYPFTPEVHVTEGVKPTKKIKGLAGQPKGGLPSNK